MKKFVYMFSEVDKTMRNLAGGKGANLGQMTKLGLPIPPGFTITTEACNYFYENKQKLSKEMIAQIEESLINLEALTGKKFGDVSNPLLVSVRSGARTSMPGMMDTILNLGLNDKVISGMAKKDARFSYDSYRRFIQMYSDVVAGVSKAKFEKIISAMKAEKGISSDTEFDSKDFQEMVTKFKELYQEDTGKKFPTDPKEQLYGAINAVFESWENPRAQYYRQMNGISAKWGTAVNVQSMVYGNLSETSGTGVAFTRNPSSGENKIYGEYLINAQGEDVVAGVRTPSPIESLKDVLPEVYEQFVTVAKKLEVHYKNMQDIEFTIENGKLYLLQTRNGKRTATAALKVAVDMVAEGLITKEEAIMQIDPQQITALLHPQFDVFALRKANQISEGLPASPGAACGQVVLSVEKAVEWTNAGKKVILVRLETSPEDIEGMHISEGVLTVRGGMTSHAAVVARGMGKCCVSSCKGLVLNEAAKTFSVNGKVRKEGDFISLDGATGAVYEGAIQTNPATISGDFKTVMEWSDEIKRLTIRANADTPKDARQAYEFGAKGIGLCRTEHMFFDEERIKAMREMILSDTTRKRVKALDKLLPMQQSDFESIYLSMKGFPVTVRYLDPPLHEFLPKEKEDIKILAKEMRMSVKKLIERIDALHEFNPMMGHRGCRLAVSYPELAEMQTTALMQAWCNVHTKHPEYTDVPEIMIPLVGELKELQFVKAIVVKTANSVLRKNHMKVDYKIGTMIEIPRAALLADELATEADFFSFGTNDLTQMTFGFSRDDASTFLPDYYSHRIYEFNPFATIDQQGVGKLVQMAVKAGRETNKDIHLGICGEHGGDPESIDFFERTGLDYVSCSPFRVPVARLAAAQATIKNREK